MANTKKMVGLGLSTATKEMDNAEDTAEKVGISALIVQVNCYSCKPSIYTLVFSQNNQLFLFLICLHSVMREILVFC